MASVLKYQKIIDFLKTEILEGKYPKGGRIPTQAELTAQHGVSRPTVEMALVRLERLGLIERRKGSGTFVIYDAPATGRRKRRFAFVALRTPRHYDLESSFVQALVSEFSSQAEAAGFEPVVDVSFGEDIYSYDFFRDAGKSGSDVDGAFILPIDFVADNNEINRTIVDCFVKRAIPVVLLDRDICLMPDRSEFDVVGINNRRSAFILTNHLINAGTEELYFVSCGLNSNAVSDRMDGFVASMTYHGLAPKRRIIWDCNRCRRGEETFLQDLIKTAPKPCGLVCLNSQTAGVVMREVLKQGFDVPADVRIAGFDDLPSSSLLYSPLTTIRQPVEAIISTAIDIMNSRLEKPDMPAREIYVAEELVVRDSCGNKIKEPMKNECGMLL